MLVGDHSLLNHRRQVHSNHNYGAGTSCQCVSNRKMERKFVLIPNSWQAGEEGEPFPYCVHLHSNGFQGAVGEGCTSRVVGGRPEVPS